MCVQCLYRKESFQKLSAWAVGELERDGAPFFIAFDDDGAGGGDGHIPADRVDAVEALVGARDEVKHLRPEGDSEVGKGEAGVGVVGVEAALDLQADGFFAERTGGEVDRHPQATLVEVGGSRATCTEEEGGEDDVNLAFAAHSHDAERGDGEGVERLKRLMLRYIGLNNTTLEPLA